MLYITDIDSESFGLGYALGDISIVKTKVYYAVCHGWATPSLVSIKNKERKMNLVSSRKINDIAINGIIYETCLEFVSVFNAMMNSSGDITTTTTTTALTTTTTTEEPIIDAILTEDELYYLITENEEFYLQLEETGE